MDGGHPTNRSIHHTYQHNSTTNYSSTSHHRYNQNSAQPKSTKTLQQIPRGPAPFASFDSIASIDVATPEERTTPVYQGKYIQELGLNR